MENIVRCFGRATGRVQGVGFRYFVPQNARELRVTGWVKDIPYVEDIAAKGSKK